MPEAIKIKKAIEKDNRSAYRAAKAANRAYIISGNTIYKVSSDGSRKAISVVKGGMVKATVKTFATK